MLMYRQCLATMDEDWSLTMPPARDVINPVDTEQENRNPPHHVPSKPARPRKQRQDDGAISTRQSTIVPPYVYTSNSAPPYAYNINSTYSKPGIDLTIVCATVVILITVAVIVTIISYQSRQISRLERRIDQILMARIIQ